MKHWNVYTHQTSLLQVYKPYIIKLKTVACLDVLLVAPDSGLAGMSDRSP